MIQAISCAVGVSAANSRCSALRLPVGGYAARFCRFPTSGARISPGVIRSGLPPCSGPVWPLIWPDLPLAESSLDSSLRWNDGGLLRSGQERQTFNSVSFGRISSHSLSSTRGRDARFPPSRERRGGVNLGLIWPCLASFTPSGEVGNEANCGPRLALVTDTGAGLGVARSGKTFISLPFPSIWFHFPSPEPSSSPSPRGRRDLPGARFPPSRERR